MHTAHPRYLRDSYFQTDNLGANCDLCVEVIIEYGHHTPRVREMFLSFTGYFVWQTTSPSADILGFHRTFYMRRKSLIEIKANSFLLCSMFAVQRYVLSWLDILLNFLSLDILSSENLPLRRTFQIFVGHVWWVWRVSRTLVGWM